MNLIDVTLLTLINIAACIVFPKLIDIFTANKTKLTQLSANNSELQIAKVQVTSFPYCTVYPLTGRQYCKFSPDFCDRCSPN
ncbi:MULTISPECIES: hypothetical protein [Nostoc]|jgi:hypothetical protein|uniref:hypothetical protein n=1 Tax=Nostoc TaxID=1177 RepID=UPI0018EF9BE4|nr:MULTISPECIES: hypothetical protein [Nostoc]MDZ8011812.1 hypothetical protein [Nostoc sp. ZfuVER08]